MLRGPFSFAIVLAICHLATPCVAPAAIPSEQLLPDTTTGFLSIPDPDALMAAWDKTQLGELTQDPVMKPFADDLKRQLRSRLTENGVRLELTLEDLEGVYGGEACLAAVQPGRVATAFAVVALVDVTGHLDKANALLAKIDANQRAKGATKATQPVGGTTITVYTLPKREDEAVAQKAYYFIRDDQLVASDHEETIKGILAKMAGGGATPLAELPAFRAVMSRVAERSDGLAPHVRWFIDPFGYLETMRAANGGRNRRGTDLLSVFQNQGFDAVRAVGGYVTFAAGDDEIVHRTVVYAPPVEGAPAGEKYRLAARMMDLGPGRDLAPPAWLPRKVATCMSFTFNMKEAFYHAETLVNEIADDEVFWDVINSIRDDPHGPQIDLVNDVVAHLGTRGVVVSDYQLPITPQSERLLMAIEMQDPTPAITKEFAQRDTDGNGKVSESEIPRERRGYYRRLLKKFDDDGDGALTKPQYIKARSIAVTIDMAMENDPEARGIKVGEHTVWEIINEPQEAVALPELQIEGIGFANIGDEEPEEEADNEKPLIPNWAIAVVRGQVLVSTHVNMLVELLESPPAGETLGAAADFREVTAALERLGASQDNVRYFARTDEAYRITYELFKEGRMPESETVLGQVLNRMLGSGEEGVLREQEIDASKLPDYQIVRRYLGPAGIYVNTEPTGDGWFVVGTLLAK